MMTKFSYFVPVLGLIEDVPRDFLFEVASNTIFHKMDGYKFFVDDVEMTNHEFVGWHNLIGKHYYHYI